ncbi:glycosyltransferase family 2 protein [Luteibaculum oceani]|uniref:glycosyltransferase family 2 protein n=1 Tax=Luteibaculum oceani TaxID=1294296 RepID=UPI00147707FA|nr:glycosyltransferase family 2 protein [Luteibaculum oceani]
MLSVIIINYNTWDLTLKLAQSILDRNEISDTEVIIVDNLSDEKMPDSIQDSECLKIVFSKTNSGFAGGINQGAAIAKHPHICVLNSDVSLKDDEPFFGPLLKTLRDGKVALVSPKIIYTNDLKIQFAGFTPINPYTGRGFAIGYNEIDRGQYNIARKMPRAHGAAMMFKKSVWEETNGIAEKYFLYYEEMDFSAKLLKAGYEIWYQPKSTAYHIGSFTMDNNETPKTFYLNRNRIWYLRNNTSTTHLLISIPYLFVTGMIRGFLALLNGRIKKADYIFTGTFKGIFSKWSSY